MPAYTADPVVWDWTIIVGDTAQPAEVALTDSTGAAFDITGASGVCQLRSEPGGVLLLSPTVTITDADGGLFTFVSPAEDTAELSPGKARYAIRLTFADDSVRTVLEGTVTIRPSVVS